MPEKCANCGDAVTREGDELVGSDGETNCPDLMGGKPHGPAVPDDINQEGFKPLTIVDAYQAIDEVVMQYQRNDGSAGKAMSDIASIIADYESGQEV